MTTEYTPCPECGEAVHDSMRGWTEHVGLGHLVLGPLPCVTCGAWVEWRGVDPLAPRTNQRHDCTPYLVAMTDTQLHERWLGLRVNAEGPLSVAGRATTAYPTMHVVPPPTPTWFKWLGSILAVVAIGLVGALILIQAAKWLS